MNYHSDFYLHKEWKLTLLALLIFPLLPTLGTLTLVLTVISTFVKKWRNIISRSHNIALACLGLWLAIASFFAWKPQEAFLGLANLLPFFVIFAGLSTIIQTPAQLRQLSWVMVISSVPVIILGFGQLFWGWSGIVDLQVIFGWVLAPQGNPPGRIASVFMYANILAIYLTIVFILGLALWIEQWQLLDKHNLRTPNQETGFINDTSSFEQQEHRAPNQETGFINDTSSFEQQEHRHKPGFCISPDNKTKQSHQLTTTVVTQLILGIRAGLFNLMFKLVKLKNQPAPTITVFKMCQSTTSNNSGVIKLLYNSSLQKFIFLTVAMISNGVALILTNSRNASGLVVFAGLTYAIYLGWNWLIGLVMAAVATVFGAAFAPAPANKWLRVIVPEYFWGRLTDRNFDRPVATLRSTQWQFAGKMTREKPWLGWGLRNFTPLYEAQMQTWLGHPHNLFLMLTAETGIPATLFFCGWVGWILGKGVWLFINWSDVTADSRYMKHRYSKLNVCSAEMTATDLPHQNGIRCNFRENRLIFFSYLVAFAACTIFNIFDVSLFDLRVNTIGWLLLAAICGSQELKVRSQKLGFYSGFPVW
ncbi:O-antigen ligase family protein [Okeania sp.]|uniref:O-antigen ligase family protein n=1 Tax=Okeania sp. TaxID=3100323 RepID=UPI002B4B5748|nr:O-antigen ligase family protein [Okeania sp.]MEB3340768.1 O-antigen ligase family protein [Okeania sp.]